MVRSHTESSLTIGSAASATGAVAAAMAAMLHDMHAYKTGSYDDHAHKGADLAREILGELKLTDGTETDVICSAIYHHDDKLVEDGPMDEVLKDNMVSA